MTDNEKNLREELDRVRKSIARIEEALAEAERRGLIKRGEPEEKREPNAGEVWCSELSTFLIVPRPFGEIYRDTTGVYFEGASVVFPPQNLDQTQLRFVAPSLEAYFAAKFAEQLDREAKL